MNKIENEFITDIIRKREKQNEGEFYLSAQEIDALHLAVQLSSIGSDKLYSSNSPLAIEIKKSIDKHHKLYSQGFMATAHDVIDKLKGDTSDS